MSEADLTHQLMPHVESEMRGAILLKHSDRTSSGYPDFTCTWHNVTSWWEVKFYDNRMFESPPLQRLTCRRLARQGICYYIIYERRCYQDIRVVIADPERLDSWSDSPDFALSFDHRWVAKFIRLAHTSIHAHHGQELRLLPRTEPFGEGGR